MNTSLITYKLGVMEEWWMAVGYWFNPLWLQVEAWQYEVYNNKVH